MINNKNKVMIFGIVILVVLMITGVTYALWQITLQQESTNVVNTACFKLNFTDENEINLQNAYPMSDESGMELPPYTFTIENICSTTATYQINLEELETELKRLSNQYVKVSLNNSKGKLLNTYSEVTPTLENAIASHKLTSGSLKENEIKTFDLRLWMDEDTPAINDVMNASFLSKITIIAVHKENIENEFTEETISLNETFSNIDETIQFKAMSEDYDIIELSEDNIIYNPLEEPSKEVVIEKTYTVDGTYTMYFKDEVGNIIESTAETTMLDQIAPIAQMDVNVHQNQIRITNKSTDEKSGISKREYKLDDGEWILGNETYSFPTSSGEHTVFLKVTDFAGNESATEETISIAEDAIIYHLGTMNYAYETASSSTGQITFNSDHIYFPNRSNKALLIKNKFSNQYRYLKIIATAEKDSAIGQYYTAQFGVQSTSTHMEDATLNDVITRYLIIRYDNSNRLNDYLDYTTFTLDLETVNEDYYVFLHGCDTIFQVQKVWLTNDEN